MSKEGHGRSVAVLPWFRLIRVAGALQTLSLGSRPDKAEKPKERIKAGCVDCWHLELLGICEVYALENVQGKGKIPGVKRTVRQCANPEGFLQPGADFPLTALNRINYKTVSLPR